MHENKMLVGAGREKRILLIIPQEFYFTIREMIMLKKVEFQPNFFLPSLL
jgi:hypothetical protein